MSVPAVTNAATCLGCGCTCDDIQVHVADGRIVDAQRACALGRAWFGDGTAPAAAKTDGVICESSQALEAMAQRLAKAESPLIYLAPDLTCEAQRAGVALADHLRATLDSVTSDTTRLSVLAAQQRGRATATLGEVRNRADVLVFWGVDPAASYPRFWTRYAPDVPGVHVPEGRRSRTVIAVDVGDAQGPPDADLRLRVSTEEEVVTLVRLAAALSAAPRGVVADPSGEPPSVPALIDVVHCLRGARYAVVVADGEAPSPSGTDPQRAEALGILSLAMNDATRGALVLLRGGGNRSGADAVATWQTGFPFAVSFAQGYPRYEPWIPASARLAQGDFDVVLILGAVSSIPADVLGQLAERTICVAGPHATTSALSGSAAVIDTGVPGVHEGGTVLRLDDVPLPVRQILEGPIHTEGIARALCERIVAVQRDAHHEQARRSAERQVGRVSSRGAVANASA